MRWQAVAVIGSMLGVTQLTGCTRGQMASRESRLRHRRRPPASRRSQHPHRQPAHEAQRCRRRLRVRSNRRGCAADSPLAEGRRHSARSGGAASRHSIRETRRVRPDCSRIHRAPPAYDVKYVDQVRQDPSDRPVELQGTAFLSVVMQGGTLDTTLQVDDPAEAQSYKGGASKLICRRGPRDCGSGRLRRGAVLRRRSGPSHRIPRSPVE